MTGLSGDRLCAQRKNKIHNKQTNKQNETRNSRDKQNKQNGETFNQRENVTGQQLEKNKNKTNT